MPIQQSLKGALLLVPLLLVQGCDKADRTPDGNAIAPAPPAGGSAGQPRPGSAPAQRPDLALDEAALIRLEHDYARALMTRDRDFLMRFYAPDWRGGNWMGFWTKSTMLKSILNERYVVKSMKVRDLKVRLMGDTAVVQGVDEEVTSLDGKDTSGKWTFTDIFARRNGEWVAIASHTSEVKPTGQ